MKSLKDKNIIKNLFISGKNIYSPTIKAKFITGDSEVLISIPIKLFKRAVDRNKLKRRIRESLKNKVIGNYSIAFIYKSNLIENFNTINSDIINILEKLKR